METGFHVIAYKLYGAEIFFWTFFRGEKRTEETGAISYVIAFVLTYQIIKRNFENFPQRGSEGGENLLISSNITVGMH